jgi:hypothetical protein
MLIIVLSQAPDVHKREQEDERNKTRDTDERNGGKRKIDVEMREGMLHLDNYPLPLSQPWMKH